MKKTLAWMFLLGNLAAIVLFWSHTSGLTTLGLGRLAGLLLEFFLLLQLVLIGRVSWIEQLFGHDGLNHLHRVVGYSLVVLLVAHPLLVSIAYGMFIGLVLNWPDVLAALIGALLFIVVIFLSIPKVRHHRLKLNYESWHLAHLLTYVAIVLAFGHQSTGGDFQNHAFFMYWIVLNFCVFGAYFMFRFVWPLWLFARHGFRVQRVVQESPDAWSVYITGRHMERFRFRGGQFANLTFFARGLWTPHPFSFSREYDGRSLRFTVKSLGDATERIASLKSGTRVLLDGPLGVFIVDSARTDKFLLISGGIGITPIRAMAGELARWHGNVAIFHAARSEAHTALVLELRTLFPHAHVFIGERITASDIARIVPDVARRDAFVCGPSPMMDAIERDLRSLGVPRAQIHAERFGY
jgi:predicted ferric reductase